MSSLGLYVENRGFIVPFFQSSVTRVCVCVCVCVCVRVFYSTVSPVINAEVVFEPTAQELHSSQIYGDPVYIQLFVH